MQGLSVNRDQPKFLDYQVKVGHTTEDCLSTNQGSHLKVSLLQTTTSRKRWQLGRRCTIQTHDLRPRKDRWLSLLSTPRPPKHRGGNRCYGDLYKTRLDYNLHRLLHQWNFARRTQGGQVSKRQSSMLLLPWWCAISKSLPWSTFEMSREGWGWPPFTQSARRNMRRPHGREGAST